MSQVNNFSLLLCLYLSLYLSLSLSFFLVRSCQIEEVFNNLSPSLRGEGKIHIQPRKKKNVNLCSAMSGTGKGPSVGDTGAFL